MNNEITVDMEQFWVELKEVHKIIDLLRNTSGSNDKICILRCNKDNEVLKTLLYYTYHPLLKYKITLSGIRSASLDKGFKVAQDPFQLCVKLSKSNIDSALRTEVASYLASIPYEECRDLVLGMLLKQLGIGVTAKTINKVFDNLIPMFEVARGESYKKVKFKKNELVAVTHKINGIRGVYRCGDFFSRQGKEIEGFNNIKQELLTLFEHINLDFDSTLLDGELVRINRDMEISDEDNFRLTSSIVNSKKRSEEDESQIEYIIFDTLPVVEFERGESSKIYFERYKDLMVIKKAILELGLNHVRVVDVFYKGEYSPEIIDSILEQTDEMGLEGVMINRNVTYKCKKSKDLVKVKSFYYNDVRCIGVYEGEEGKECEGTLGGIIVNYKGFEVRSGSGFKAHERDAIWDDPSLVVGKIVTIKCKGESRNSKDDSLSMQFPIFVTIREDKDEESYES